MESLQFFVYLVDWYKHRGADQAKVQFGVQGINQNTIEIQFHAAPKTIDLRCKINHLVTSKSDNLW